MSKVAAITAPETVLKDDRELLQLLIEGVRDYAIYLLTPEGNVATWNTGAEKIKGYAASEIIGQHFSKFYPPDLIQRAWPEMELRVAKEEGRFEDEGWRLRKDGSLFWANVIITAIRDKDGQLLGFAKITRDLTERVKHEESLRVTEARLQLLIDSVVDHAVFMLDPEGRVASWNGGANRLKGYTANEIIGQHFSKFYPQDAIDRKWPEHELAMALEYGRVEDVGWRIRKDGTRFWANVTIAPIYDSKHELRGYAKVTRDMTERNRSIALQTSEKHMNEFIATLGHELRNPLGAISNAATIVKMVGGDKRLQAASGVIERQLGQLSRLVDDLLDVARIREGKFVLHTSRVDLWPIVIQATEGVPMIAQKSHSLTLNAPREPLLLEGDIARLNQVFVNVLGNAAKYMNEGGSITVTGERETHEAVVRIVDTGYGIDPELLPNVFDLFRQGERSLHDSKGGLGIGLTLVQRIVQLHGGSVEARSHGIGKGSEFTIRLPLLP